MIFELINKQGVVLNTITA
jgi:hypothetical protein